MRLASAAEHLRETLLAAVNPEPNENERTFGWFMGRALVSTAFVAVVCGVLVRTVGEGIVVGAFRGLRSGRRTREV